MSCKNQTKLYHSFIKHGFENHSFEIIEVCPDYLLNVLEADYILMFDAINSGLNISNEQFGYRTKKEKEKIVKALTGRKASEETKRKMSESQKIAQKGRKVTWQTRKISQMVPVVRVSKDGKEKIYESLLSVEREGFDSTCVGKVCKGGKYRNSHKGFYWKYLNKAA